MEIAGEARAHLPLHALVCTARPRAETMATPRHHAVWRCTSSRAMHLTTVPAARAEPRYRGWSLSSFYPHYHLPNAVVGLGARRARWLVSRPDDTKSCVLLIDRRSHVVLNLTLPSVSTDSEAESSTSSAASSTASSSASELGVYLPSFSAHPCRLRGDAERLRLTLPNVQSGLANQPLSRSPRRATCTSTPART